MSWGLLALNLLTFLYYFIFFYPTLISTFDFHLIRMILLQVSFQNITHIYISLCEKSNQYILSFMGIWTKNMMIVGNEVDLI